MKFLADMGISLRTVSWLRNAGYDNENYQAINERLTEILNQCEEDLQEGAIISVSNEAFRVKRLPI